MRIAIGMAIPPDIAAAMAAGPSMPAPHAGRRADGPRAIERAITQTHQRGTARPRLPTAANRQSSALHSNRRRKPCKT